MRLLAKLEGRPLPRGEALAVLLGCDAAAARRFVTRFRERGVLRLADAVQAPPESCDCVSHVRIDWSRVSDQAALERRICMDPAILVADLILGNSDYRLFSRHRDFRAAHGWIRQLESDPAIGQMTTRFCAGLRARPNYAAARLARTPDEPAWTGFEP
ncbi:hypothetical protein [Phenylobacterium sp.]|uniref:hypothetical protein n=1 Tax=Phenylobacterium sp. TaxID=1871053 RepID=UPI0035651A5C